MIKAIFWDNDGVLVDTEQWFFRATREILAQAGIELTQERYTDISLKQGQSVFQLAAENGVSEDEIERLRTERNERYSELLRATPLVIPGVPETLARLHGRFTMGIVTSSNPEHFEIIHSQSNLLRYFDFIVTSLEYTHYKPHPEPYLRALEHTGLPPEDCIVVEDSPRGLAAANAAGLRCLVIPTELTRGDDFPGAYMVLKDIAEITPELLTSL